MSINFSLSKLSESSYSVTASLTDNQGRSTSKDSFTFTSSRLGMVSEVPAHDIASINANIDLGKAPKMASVFNKTALSEIDTFLSRKLALLPQERDTLMVVDIRSKHRGYSLDSSDQERLLAAEDAVVGFMSSPITTEPQSNAERFKHRAREVGVTFALMEGSLKARILSAASLSPGLLEHLTSREGAADFCQFTEFFMNAAKFGQTCQGSTSAFQLNPIEYIQPLSTAGQVVSSWTPHSDSTVHYPESYWGFHDTNNAPYARSIAEQRGVFAVEKVVNEADQLFSVRLRR